MQDQKDGPTFVNTQMYVQWTSSLTSNQVGI
jgi:hypothetical protein